MEVATDRASIEGFTFLLEEQLWELVRLRREMKAAKAGNEKDWEFIFSSIFPHIVGI